MSLRAYSFKDVVMLMAAKTILQSMLANLAELSMVRTNWTETYVNELILKIDDAIETFLGLDKKQPLREATDVLNKIQVPAVRDLALIKVQIEVDFGVDALPIKKALGLHKKLHETDQEDLIETLYAFKKGMTPEMKTAMTEKGTNPVLIDTIVGYASELQQANLSQEGLKVSTKEISQEAVNTFNTIYTEVIGISKIASKVFTSDPLKRDQFVFSKVVKNMGVAKETTAE
jgi:hypothetical protein